MEEERVVAQITSIHLQIHPLQATCTLPTTSMRHAHLIFLNFKEATTHILHIQTTILWEIQISVLDLSKCEVSAHGVHYRSLQPFAKAKDFLMN